MTKNAEFNKAIARVFEEIERTISHTAQKDPWLKAHPPEVEWFGYDAEPWLQDENHTFVQSFRESATPVVGQKIEAIGIPAAMDTRFAAYHDIPTLAFDCKGEPWHGIDEQVEIESLKTVTKVIAKFILDFCGVK
jgi:acetylornithine deacetylase